MKKIMIVKIPYSSSEGNVLEICNDNTKIFLDVGCTGRQLFSHSPEPADAIFISHEHSDHIRAAGKAGRKWNCPIFIESVAFEKVLKSKTDFFKNCQVELIEAGERVAIGDLQITAHTTSHDSAGGLAFQVDGATGRFASITDTGTIDSDLGILLGNSDALLIESNYDSESLRLFPHYTAYLKRRIASNQGHLSNEQCMDSLAKYADFSRLRWVAFGHLSPRSNRPDIVESLAKERFPNYPNFWIAPGEMKF